MKVEQVHALVNTTTTEILGEEGIINEDLSNMVDIGEKVINTKNIENFAKTLVDHIGKVIFVDRTYEGSAPSVMMDAWEYGSILEKVSGNLPEAIENETWELEDKKSYDPNIFYQPKVQAKFFNSKITFEVDQSFTERQVKSAFSSATQMNAFLSMLHNEVEKSLTIKKDSLIMRTINNMIAQTLNSGGSRVINLLTLFNAKYASKITTPLTADAAIVDPDFIRFASYIMSLYQKRLTAMSTLFNMGEQPRFTPQEYLHTVMLHEFYSAASVFLESETFHNDLVKLPKTETVAFWQASGTDYNFATTSSIDVKIKSEDEVNGKVVKQSGILGVMFDKCALGVANLDRRVTTNWNPKGEFFNNFHKFDAGYFNDGDENFIVFTAN